MILDWKLTWRNLLRDKAYVFLNLFSLSVSISCSLILLSYILSEMSYDEHFPDHERIFRITTEIQRSESNVVSAGTARVLAPYLDNEYPGQIEDYARFKSTPLSAYAHDDLMRDWENVWFTDDSVFSLFGHEVIHGNPDTALDNPNSIAISESFSRFYFGSTNPIGELIETGGEKYEITLVYKDLPDNTHLKHNALLSANGDEEMLRSRENPAPGGVFGLNVITYVKLAEAVSHETFESQMADFYSRIEPATLAQQLESKLAYRAQPLASIHYAKGVRNILPTGNINTIYAFCAILIALLVVSSANYTNLALAKSMKNAKQIGTMKILGVQNQQLSIRFVTESILQGVLALLFALCLIELIEATTQLPYILGRTSLYDVSEDIGLLLWSIALILVLSLSSSIYPAFYLSSVSPLVALNASNRKVRHRVPLQRSLLGIQLFISVVILATTLLMSVQIAFLLGEPIGANYENVISVKLRGIDAVSSSPEIVNSLKENPEVFQVSASSYVLGEAAVPTLYRIERESGGFISHSVAFIRTDSNFLNVLELKLKNGRYFIEESDAELDQSAIVNDALVREMGWDDPIGKRLGFPVEGFEEGDKYVVGVIEDFHISSLHSEIEPLIIGRRSFRDFDIYSLDEGELIRENLLVRYAGNDLQATLAVIESTISRYAPNYVLDYELVSDKVEDQYLDDVYQMALFGLFAVVSILLSCLGIFGLMSFTMERRSKELSIRRIIGATLLQISNLLAKEYILLLLAVAIPASILAYLLIQDWLSLFAYYARVNLWAFVLATAVIAALTYCVISIRLLTLARSNLADELRYE